MLVLTRKCGEKIMISDQGITVTVLEVHGERVRLGIEAPAHIKIYRQEIWTKIRQTKAENPERLAEPVASA